ncbi:MAG: methyltransferase domain-containing protein [Chloroflexota bacterium]
MPPQRAQTNFNESEWADPERAGYYRDTADHYIVDRQMHLFILQSFYRFYLAGREQVHLLDLGCGDGVLTQALLAVDPTIQATLLDGAKDMIKAAQVRLEDHPGMTFIHQQFDEFTAERSTQERYDLVVSSFAIHHLYLDEKVALFRAILRQLKPGGAFLNIDTVLSDSPIFETWYRELWQEWISQRQERLQLDEDYTGIPEEARMNPDNKLSTLSSQLEALKSVGFVDVGRHYQNGVFAIFGGRKST